MSLTITTLPDWTGGGTEVPPNTKGYIPGGPFKVGSSLYIVSNNYNTGGAGGTGAQLFAVFKSTDSGVTWAQKDQANAPLNGSHFSMNASACVSGALIVTAYFVWNNGTGTFQLKASVFSTASDTFTRNDAGPDTGLPINNTMDGFSDMNQSLNCAATSSGSVSIAYSSEPGSTPSASYTNYNATTGVFSGTQTLKTDGTGIINYVPYGIYIDSADRKYIPILRYNLTSTVTDLICVTLNAANAVASTTTISTDVFSITTALGNATQDEGVINGGYSDTTNSRVVISRVNTAGNLALSIASFADTPIWTPFSSTISMIDDGTASGIVSPQPTILYYKNPWCFQYAAPYDAGGTSVGILFFKFNSSAASGQFYCWDLYSTTFNGTTFSTPTLQISASTTQAQIAGICAANQGGTVYLTLSLSSLGFPLAYEPQVFASFAIGGTTPVVLSGPGRGPLRHITLTPADLCLARDFRLLDRIDPTALSCHRRPPCISAQDFFDGYQDARIDHIPLPAEARRFFPVGSIALPVTALGNVAVFSLHVPTGYDGYILGHFHEYIGPNFSEGSGDIVWRIKINQRYLRDSGNLLVTLGSQRTLEPIEGGISISSGDLIQYLVSVPNLSGLLIPGIGNVICGLFGYFYPRT